MRDLVGRYVKHGWGGRRLEIHVYSVDENGVAIGLNSKPTIPYVVVWRKTIGLVRPSARELEEFYRAHYRELKRIAIDVVEGRWANLPPIYWEIGYALEANVDGVNDWSGIQDEHLKLCARIVGSVAAEAKKLLRDRLKRLAGLVNTVEPKTVNEYLVLGNELRKTLKELLALSYIVNSLTNSLTVSDIVLRNCRGCTESFVKAVEEYIVRSGGRQGFRRNTLREVLRQILSSISVSCVTPT